MRAFPTLQYDDDIEDINEKIAKIGLNSRRVPVVFILGQSNSDGRGNTTDLPDVDTTFNGEVRIWDKPIVRNPANAGVNRNNDGAWKDYALGDMVVSPNGASATAFGPEFPLARRWKEEMGSINQPLHIIKLAVGGTKLADSGGVDTSWHPDDEESLRYLATEYVATPALLELELQGLEPVCLGIFWGQGESDANATDAPNYRNNLDDLLLLRADLGFPDANLYVMGLSKFDDGDPHWEAVKQAQIDFSEDEEDVTLIPTDGTGGYYEVGTFVEGISAGGIHYSSAGVMGLGSLLYDQLNIEDYSEYKSPWDFSFVGGAYTVGTPINNELFSKNADNGTLGIVSYPTSAGSSNAVTWVRNGNDPVRAAINAAPVPSINLNPLLAHTDVEVVFRMIHDGDLNTKPGFHIRSSGDYSSPYWSQYLTQVRAGGNQLTMFKNDGTGWVALSGSPVTPSQSPATSDPYWYRLTMIGNELTVYNSPDGKVWTQQYQVTDTDHASGDLLFSLYNGLLDKNIGSLRVAHCAFDVILARRI